MGFAASPARVNMHGALTIEEVESELRPRAKADREAGSLRITSLRQPDQKIANFLLRAYEVLIRADSKKKCGTARLAGAPGVAKKSPGSGEAPGDKANSE